MKMEEMLILSQDGKLEFSASLTMAGDVMLTLRPSLFATDDVRLAYKVLRDANPLHYFLESQRTTARRFRTLDAVARFLLRHGVSTFTVINCS